MLITGASSGFGRCMAEGFARAGYLVFAGMRDVDGRNAGVRGELEGLGAPGTIEALELDVTDDAGVERAVAEVIARRGRIDVLINNAGISLAGLAECSSVDQARRVFETNYFGPLRMGRAVLPHMRARRSGLVVYMSSIGGRVALPNAAHYGASKAALEVLAEVQSYELTGLGIDVAILEPGAYATSIFKSMAFADDEARAAEYGALADKAGQGIGIALQMTADGTPDPREVADAVVRIAAMPAGQRPLRTLMGAEAVILEPINAVTEPLSRKMFEMFGFL